MNAVIAPTFSCFHCGADCGARPVHEVVGAQARDFCCNGCASASRWITRAGLDAYYSLRSVDGTKAIDPATDLAAWDAPELALVHSRAVGDGREITVLTDGMHCAACAWLIDQAITREAGVVEVAANAATGRVRIVWDPARRPLSEILGVLSRLGYSPHLAGSAAEEENARRERNRWLLRTGIAALASVQTMMFAEALYLDTTGSMAMATRDFLRWIAFLVSTPVVFYCGWPFLAGAWRELTRQRLGMDTLVSVSVVLAWAASTIETLRGGAQVWFDAVAMFVFLLLVGRYLEQRVRVRSRARLDALARAQPPVARRISADGTVEQVPLAALRVDDVCLVPTGATVPADGTLLGADTSFNESLLTGEALPVTHHEGDPVLAGAVCVQGPARVRVTHVGAATRLAAIVRLVQAAQLERPPLAKLADRVASRFVIALLIASAVAFGIWQAIDPDRAFEIALALLVISCPCALSLAVPAALAAAHDALLRWGVLPVRSDALEVLSAATDVVFDKTGTLTIGRGRLAGFEACAGAGDTAAVLRLAASLAAHSTHPHAATLREACNDTLLAVSEVREHRGLGLEGVVDGRRLRLGTAPFATGAAAPDDFLWLGDGDRPLARCELRDTLRPEAHRMVEALGELGITPHVFSGDGESNVHRCAVELGIVDARARQTPEAKLEAVRDLQRQGRRVIVVGDGINDAPVLAGADVSIAIASGADLAQRSADLVWTRPTLDGLPALLGLSRRTQSVIAGNFWWAIGYNGVAIPLAALGLVTPWMAALAMVASSLTVTVNALRLTGEPRQ